MIAVTNLKEAAGPYLAEVAKQNVSLKRAMENPGHSLDGLVEFIQHKMEEFVKSLEMDCEVVGMNGDQLIASALEYYNSPTPKVETTSPLSDGEDEEWDDDSWDEDW